MDDLYRTELDRLLDRAKTYVFMGKNAAFLGPLMCSLEFIWDPTIPTAATNGTQVLWNPYWFLNLTIETRQSILLHELWHVGLLHVIRIGNRDPKIWNIAADIRLDNDMEAEGLITQQQKQMGCFLGNPAFGPNMPVEEIYEQLIQQGKQPPPDYAPDLQPATPQQKQQVVNAVVQAVTSAKMNGGAGTIPGETQHTLNQFLAPVIPWEQKLYKFFNDMLDMDYSWSVRDRRYRDIYMPGEEMDGGKLDCLDYYLDVSGSVTNRQVIRFNSEVKYIKERFNPTRLRLIQFDTKIQKVQTFLEDDPFEELVVVGRGGTSLRPVREMIDRDRPTAAIIFSDLDCAPMQPLTYPVPIIWVAIDNRSATVPFGDQLIHIKA